MKMLTKAEKHMMQNRNVNTIPTMTKMSDGLIEYYKEELAMWTRALAFYTMESEAFVQRISAMLHGQGLISAGDEKEMNAFIDQFAVQQQEFDHLSNQVKAQKLKLEATNAASGSADDAQTNQRHDVLRSHMLKAERNFMKSKYACSAFLPTTFG